MTTQNDRKVQSKENGTKFTLRQIAFFIVGFTAPASLSGEFSIYKGIMYVFIGIVCGYGLVKLEERVL